MTSVGQQESIVPAIRGPTSFGNERKPYQQNRNFVCNIEPGAIALVPRPSRGVVYAGRVTTRFEVLNDPPWGNEYLDLRCEQGLDSENEFSHLADVAQWCEVDHFRAGPFPVIFLGFGGRS